MNADERRSELNAITERIIGCAYIVANQLGTGFLEKIYENALTIELQKAGLYVEPQKPIKVFYDGQIVGEFFADLLINQEVIVELKAQKFLEESHTAQCMNYLKATGLNICLLINFGKPKIEIKRYVLDF
ncbi:MAG TPA: GxxExxY protein [Methylophilaceae bacterium]|nr:GxxExxY protein [Methylophilaceae bacterium]